MGFFSKLFGLGGGTKKIEWINQYVKNRHVLDIGCCGEGEKAYLKDNWLHGHIKSVAGHCTGLDLNEKAINHLASLGYDVIAGNAQEFNLDNSFDVVVAADILEHLEDMKGFFASVSRVLSEDGYLIITTPNPWFLFIIINCIFKGYAYVNSDHVTWFCVSTVRELLSRYGYTIEKFEYGSSEPIFYRLGFFRPILFHTSIFIAAKKKRN
jgi:2-polyprenyl-3-methyl-5-hydroxy-6-metoxy-1,4-benzoquinol methylase